MSESDYQATLSNLLAKLSTEQRNTLFGEFTLACNQIVSKAASTGSSTETTQTQQNSSVKVKEPPGGKSSIFLGGEPDKPVTGKGGRVPGAGASSIVIGDDSSNFNTEQPMSKGAKARAAAAAAAAERESNSTASANSKSVPPGGQSSGIFGTTSSTEAKSSVGVVQPPGGASQVGQQAKFISNEKASEDEVSDKERSDISTLIYSKGKVKDVFNKISLNKSKMTAVELQVGLEAIGYKLQLKQAQSLVAKYGQEGTITFSHFIKMVSI